MDGTLQFMVGAGEEGRRLDEFLAARLAALSRMRIAALLACGGCSVNGEAAGAGWRLRAGDAVEVAGGDDSPNSMTPEPMRLEIVSEDEHIAVVVKPAGLLVHPTRGVKTGTLANALAHHFNRMRIADCGLRIDDLASPDDGACNALERDATPDESIAPSNPQSAIRNPQSETPQSETPNSAIRDPQWIRPGIVHRLDRDTSGLLVVAKTQEALSRLSQHFQRRLVEKRYTAVVAGRVEQDLLTVVAPIGRDEEGQPHWRVSEGGKESETRLRVLERRGRRTLVELEPVTGRTNQLRIHCAHAGHPIVGDILYGGERHARLCLHASRLAFRHPATNERVEFSSELPREVESALDDEG